MPLDTSARDILVLIVNVILLAAYLICMTTMLVKVKLKLPVTALIVVFSYLLVFIPKVISDSMRVNQNMVPQLFRTTVYVLVTFSDRIKDVIIDFYIMTLDQMRHKIQSQSSREYQTRLGKQKLLWITLISGSILASIGNFTVICLRSFQNLLPS